jgi:hypothetical protein
LKRPKTSQSARTAPWINVLKWLGGGIYLDEWFPLTAKDREVGRHRDVENPGEIAIRRMMETWDIGLIGLIGKRYQDVGQMEDHGDHRCWSS